MYRGLRKDWQAEVDKSLLGAYLKFSCAWSHLTRPLDLCSSITSTTSDKVGPSTNYTTPPQLSPASLPPTFQTLQGLNQNHLSFLKPPPVRVRS